MFFNMLQNMSSESVCNTHLGLGLGSQMMPANESKSSFQGKKPCFEPSLTLSLWDEAYSGMEESIDLHLQASSQSDVSSFSNTKVKRERDLGSEETMEVEKLCKRVVSDEDEDGNGRKKLRLAKEQSALLEDSFKENTTLNPKQKLVLAKQLNLRPRQVEVWFQNRRARTKLKQTEVDCGYLKKYCEALTHENKRLQKEVQELKSLKVATQLYMHVPAATLTMCPFCEGIGGGGIRKTSFAVATEHHLSDPFNLSSAAC